MRSEQKERLDRTLLVAVVLVLGLVERCPYPSVTDTDTREGRKFDTVTYGNGHRDGDGHGNA